MNAYAYVGESANSTRREAPPVAAATIASRVMNRGKSSPKRLRVRVYSHSLAPAMKKTAFPVLQLQIRPIVGVANCNSCCNLPHRTVTNPASRSSWGRSIAIFVPNPAFDERRTAGEERWLLVAKSAEADNTLAFQGRRVSTQWPRKAISGTPSTYLFRPIRLGGTRDRRQLPRSGERSYVRETIGEAREIYFFFSGGSMSLVAPVPV